MKEPGTHKLTEAMEGHAPAAEPSAQHGPPGPGGHGSNPQEIAEDARRQQEARSDGRVDREDRLVNTGRAQQTHG